MINSINSDLSKRTILIQGSAAPETPDDLLVYSHRLIRELTLQILDANGSLLVRCNSERRKDEKNPETAFWFDWTIVEAVEQFVQNKKVSPHQNILTIFQSEKDISIIPHFRQRLWKKINSLPCIQFKRLPIGMNAGAYARIEMARLADTMICIGGGEGIEHFTKIMLDTGKPVFPIGLPIAAHFGDGFLGSESLARIMKTNPIKYLGTDDNYVTSKLNVASPTDNSISSKEIATAIIQILKRIVKPKAFLVRLLNTTHSDYEYVEAFFEETIKPLLLGNSYYPFQSGGNEPTSFFINVEIFEQIQLSQIVVADITGLRPNCFIELGMSLGREIPVLLTAIEGTTPVFDVHAIETYFWSPNTPNDTRIKEAKNYLRRALNRPSIIRSVPLI